MSFTTKRRARWALFAVAQSAVGPPDVQFFLITVALPFAPLDFLAAVKDALTAHTTVLVPRGVFALELVIHKVRLGANLSALIIYGVASVAFAMFISNIDLQLAVFEINQVRPVTFALEIGDE